MLYCAGSVKSQQHAVFLLVSFSAHLRAGHQCSGRHSAALLERGSPHRQLRGQQRHHRHPAACPNWLPPPGVSHATSCKEAVTGLQSYHRHPAARPNGLPTAGVPHATSCKAAALLYKACSLTTIFLMYASNVFTQQVWHMPCVHTILRSTQPCVAHNLALHTTLHCTRSCFAV